MLLRVVDVHAHHSGVLGSRLEGVKVAVLGYPNVGKSSLFNSVVRGSVEVANWPGTTVEVNVGRVAFNGFNFVFFDLPGVYGFTGSSVVERVVESFLLTERPDVALVLVDSTSIERSLSLALQVMELHDNVVLALTKLDVAHGRGVHVNIDGLSKALNVTVVPTSIVWGLGVREVLEAVARASKGRGGRMHIIYYGVLEPYVRELSEELERRGLKYPSPRWASVKLLEGDRVVEEAISKLGFSDVVERARKVREEVSSAFGRDPTAIVAEYRFNMALNLARQYVVRAPTKLRVEGTRLTKIDMLFIDRRTSIVASLSLMALLFLTVFTINTGFPVNIIFELLGLEEAARFIESISLGGVVGSVIDILSSYIESQLAGGPPWLVSFVVEGIIGGLGAVLLLAPLILIASALVAVLEDSGLLPRVAVGSHRLLCRIGFSGHSVLPVTVCLGCNVAGIITARGVPGYWERLKFYILGALIPCQARLVVLVVLAGVIGGLVGALSLLAAYAVSLSLLALLSILLDRVTRAGGGHELLLEIPEMHKPIGRVIWWISWSRIKHYLAKAGTIIFLGSIAMWLLLHTTPTLSYTENPEDSIAGALARTLTPLFKPLGVERWEVVLALIAGFVAKEIFLSTVVVATGNPNPVEAMAHLSLGIPTIVTVMVFIALYTPCLATVAVIRSESRNTKVALVAVLLALITAYTVALSIALLGDLILSL
ncbi:MAG: ferrous iron transport protein B, partial [Acidilobaceae archaeon]